MANNKLTFFNASDEWLRKLCGNRVVTNEEDFNLKEGAKNTDKLNLFPVTGGLYDGKLFGSLYAKRCNCGALKTVGERCHICCTDILSEAERAVRWCMYYSSVYYTNPPRMEVMKDRLGEIFDGIRFDLKGSEELFYGGHGSRGGINWRNIFNLAQFNVDTSEGKTILVITDDLTDSNYISLQGILNIIDEWRPAYSDEFRTYMNRIIPIMPIALRPARLSVFSGKKKLELSPYTIMYRSIIRMDKLYWDRIQSEDNIYAETLLKATLREFIGSQLYSNTDIAKGSRSNFFRTSYTHRVAGSGRAVISPDPSLTVAECGIPFFAAYEMYKTEFIAFIERTYLLNDKKEAIELYKQAKPDILELFQEFVETSDKHVLLNRNPTLHKYNILCMKVKLVKDATIHLPMMCCALYGGDFDGDELNFFAVPDELKDYCVSNASPKNMCYYEKDHAFLYQFNHESLNGIIISSKCSLDGEPKRFISFDDIEEAFNNGEIEVDTAVDFNDRITSYGREKISQIIDCSLDSLIGEGVSFNAKNIVQLYALMAKYDGDTMVHKLQKLQEFVLEMVYLSGETTLPLEDIYSGLPNELTNNIKSIANSDKYSTEEKLMYIQKLHEDYLKSYMDILGEKGEKVKLRITESSRMKMGAFLEMATPQILYNADKSIYVSEHTLIDGLTEAEYAVHALNNRKLLELKFQAVPTSGYLTRQLSTLGQSLVLRPGDDPENGGIKIPRYRAEGRTLVKGGTVGKSDSEDNVVVRSILTSTKDYLTADMISTFNKIVFDSDGVDHKGTSFMMSLTESTTQKGLSLKHGGALRTVIEEDKMYAATDCTLELYDKFFVLNFEDGYIAKYPRTASMVFNKSQEKFRKGDIICQLTKLYTFSYVLDCVIKLCRAVGRVTLADVKNQIQFQRCISIVSGVLRYNFEEGYVSIGNERIEFRPDTLYFIPDGEEIEFGTKFCSGLENVQALMQNLVYIETYYIFRAQFRLLMPHIAEEIIECLFYLITNRDDNVFRGVLQSNVGNTSFVPNLAFGYAKRGLIKAVKGGSEIKKDTYTNSIINPFLVKDMMDAIEGKFNEDEE